MKLNENESNIKENIKRFKNKKSKKTIGSNNSEKETHNNTKKNKFNKDNIPKNKKHNSFLGKKRKIPDYKKNSLKYYELYKLFNKEDISLNINNLFTVTNINPNLVQGRFVALLENEKKDNDILIEMTNKDNPIYSRYTVYDTKKFEVKLSFLEINSGIFYFLFQGYAAFITNDAIKIYHFSKNNTNYDIFQKIFLPEEQKDSILFLFKFSYNDDFYFFNKIFSLNNNNKILLYKYNKDEKENENDFAIKGKTFVENIYLNLNFEFIWFAQKNNNELLFFYEENFIFKIFVYDFSRMEVINQKIIKLNNINYVKIANYSDKIINSRYLPLSNQNFLYFIDTLTCQISTIKELDVIEFFKICEDNTLWTIETIDEKSDNINNNYIKKKSKYYLRQYKIIVETMELVKLGERRIKTDFITDNIIHINNKKLLLFEKGRKLILYK